METLYLLAGSKISRRDNTVRITPKDGKARNFPVESLKHIIVAGTSQFNSELLTFLGKRGVRLSFLDYYGNLLDLWKRPGHTLPERCIWPRLESFSIRKND